MERICITIHNDIKLINVALAGAVSYAKILGFGEKECRHIELILEEVLSNVIKYDYMPGQNENIDIDIETTTLGIGIRIKSKGVPLDVDAIKTFEKVKPEDILNHGAHGLGILLIKSFTDEVVYTNKGKEGQEVWVEKYLPYEHINKNENLPPEANVKSEETVKVDFYIRRIKPEESPVISRLAYYAYNLTYIYDQIYYPERVRHLNETNEMMSYVAVNRANEEIIGHCALIKEDLSDFVEMGVAFVNPAYRGSGCLKDLSKYQLADIEKMAFSGFFGHAVTTHVYSQKAIYALGCRESALLVSRLTALQMNKINTENATRDSLIYHCRYFAKQRPEKIYTPAQHHEMIVKIFNNIDVEVQSYETAVAKKTESCGVLSMIETKTDAYLCAHIFVKQFGTDVLTNVGKTLKAFCVNRIETVYLFLPLEFPETSYLCSDFETMGFFFGGVKPAKEGKTWLLLQYLNNQKYDYDKLRFCSDFGQELMNYIKDHDPNIEKE